MSTTLEIVQGISQVIANSFDGALDSEGKPIKVGLKREKEYKLSERRFIDGFKIKLQGKQLVLLYHAEITNKEKSSKNYDQEVESIIADVIKYIKKEYKKATKSTLSLTQKGKMQITFESTSMIRSWVRAQCLYDIKNVEGEKTEERKIDKSIRDWVELGGNKE